MPKENFEEFTEQILVFRTEMSALNFEPFGDIMSI